MIGENPDVMLPKYEKVEVHHLVRANKTINKPGSFGL